jgi:hypothetical protein
LTKGTIGIGPEKYLYSFDVEWGSRQSSNLWLSLWLFTLFANTVPNMNQQRLLFEYSPAFLFLCLAAGLGYAFVLYGGKQPWGIITNRTLFGLRTVLVACLAFLLVGPILKLTQNSVEKPAVVFLLDNSLSVREAVDSLHRDQLKKDISALSARLEGQGYQVALRGLSDDENPSQNFVHPTSDLAGALRDLRAGYEGRNLAGIVLLSDGIYNSGASPLYATFRIPVFTVGLGDTTLRKDLLLKNIEFNKIAYQGNKFPLRATVLAEGLADQAVVVSLFQGGTLVNRMTKNSGLKPLINFDFLLDAKEKGLQRIDVVVEPVSQERNQKNNRATAFVEVVEGKKKILLIAPAPHPDIKALRSVVEKNSNYEFIVHIPGVKEADPSILRPDKADLIIFHEVADIQGKTTGLFSQLSKGATSLLLIVGTGSNLRSFQSTQVPLIFEKAGQWDEVTPVINPIFRDFGFSENINLAFSKFPPAPVPFGKFSYPPNASILLYQQIGSVTTDRPLLFTTTENGRKTGVLMTDGIWRWRLNEYAETEKTEAFDEVFSKLIQYLSTQEDKRKFRVFPLQHEFTDAEPVLFESQVYNDLFEQVYGNTIAIDIRDEKGKITSYNYVTSPGATRYRIGGLKEGVYRYTASTQLNAHREEIKGEFLVKAQNIESQNLTADFGLLRKLSDATGGKFYSAANLSGLEKEIKNIQAKGLIHSEDSFNPMINLPWVFFVLLLLVSTEWFFRKYLGAY